MKKELYFKSLIQKRNFNKPSDINTISYLNKDVSYIEYKINDICKLPFPECDLDKIPKKIFTMWHTLDLPPFMKKTVDIMKDTHNDFEYYIYDQSMCENFLKEYFTDEILWASNSLIPFAYKSDLWRYCLLYIYGGIYYDIKFQTINDFTFHKFLDREYFCNDTFEFNNGFNTINGLLICKPRNSYILKAIKSICQNIHDNYYGENSLMPAGPGLLGIIFPPKDYKMRIGNRDIDNTNTIFLDNKPIIKGYIEYRDEQKLYKDQLYYGESWTKRNIYLKSSIPKLIFQTWITEDIPNFLKENIENIKKINPDYTYSLYSDDQCRKFISENFSSDVLWAFDTLIPGTFKADLFRYCILYRYGGIYLDIKYCPINFRFDELINNEVFITEPGEIIYQGFIMCNQFNSKCRQAIYQVVENVKNQYYGDGITYPTGPCMFTKFFSNHEINNCTLSYIEQNGIGKIYNRLNNRILLQFHSEYRKYQHETYAKNGIKYWKTMWAERSIYKLENYNKV
jgi:mannosyltransferase OCH1-like enzyme